MQPAATTHPPGVHITGGTLDELHLEYVIETDTGPETLVTYSPHEGLTINQPDGTPLVAIHHLWAEDGRPLGATMYGPDGRTTQHPVRCTET